MNLSQEQRNVVNNSNSNMYINAGPGSGKSTVLSIVAKELLNVPTARIILLTFTNKAAKNIIDKVSLTDVSRVIGGTFHKISYRFMREAGQTVKICDEGKKRLIIKRIFNCRKDKQRYENLYKEISRQKSKYPVIFTPNVQRYQEELTKYNMVDFDDIINYGTDLITKVRPSLNVSHILVDELQDTSQNQLEFLKALQDLTKAKMVGVGDGDQSIFEWRNAKPANVKGFIDSFNCETYELGINFRSKYNIVQHSRTLIEKNKDRLHKNLRANDTSRGRLEVYHGWNPYDEVDQAVAICKRYPTRDIAILYRDRVNKPKLEYGLTKAGIEYLVTDSTEILGRSAFRILLSMMKIAAGIHDIYDIEQGSKGMKRVGPTTVKLLRDRINETNGTLQEAVEHASKNKRTKSALSVIGDLNKEFTKLNKNDESLDKLVDELLRYIVSSLEIPPDIFEFLKEMSSSYKTRIIDIREMCNDFGLNNKQESSVNNAKVLLSTVHGFKGLESDIVIMPFCNWEIRPDSEVKNVIESERRLFYVAVTRAKNELHMTYTGLARPKFIREMNI